MIGNNVWPEHVRDKLLHILPQHTNHAEAEIRGSPAALRRLGEALIKASDLPQTEWITVEMMARDGEHYDVVCRPMSDQQMESGPLPYAQLGQPWDFDA